MLQRPSIPRKQAFPPLNSLTTTENLPLTTLPATPPGRRQFLSLGTTVAATIAATTAFGPSSSQAIVHQDRKGPWIPPGEFLAELPQIMEVASLPGLAMAVVENGETVWTHVAGVTNVETRTPVREDSIFEAASMSKPVFAYVVMKLADEKLIDLDRPLVQYRRPDYLPKHPYIDLITARDVLRHSTGLPNWRNVPEDSLIPAFKPGSRWRYSGEGYFWLQLVVEQITGKGVDTVIRSRLFDPAGMTLCTFGWNADRARLAVYGHKVPDGGDAVVADLQFNRELGGHLLPVAAKWGRPISTWTYDDVLRALPEAPPYTHPVLSKAPAKILTLPQNLLPNVAASLGTTASEYSRFIALMMERPKRAGWEITEVSRRAMLSHQMMMKANAIYWGLGWGLETPSSGPLFHHGGNNGGMFKTFGVGDAARRRAIVIFTNGGSGDRVCERIVRATTGHDLLEFLL